MQMGQIPFGHDVASVGANRQFRDNELPGHFFTAETVQRECQNMGFLRRETTEKCHCFSGGGNLYS